MAEPAPAADPEGAERAAELDALAKASAEAAAEDEDSEDADPIQEDQELDQEKAGDTPDEEMERIEKEKKDMSVVEKLERSIVWKAEGNDHFKKNDIFKAADAYYHAILYCRDLTQNPKYYPKCEHNEEQRKLAQDLCESVFTNLALVQLRYGATLEQNNPERPKVYGEAAKSASEGLKLNPKNVKALYRRGVARAALARGAVKNAEGQKLCTEAKADLVAVVQEDPNNKDARAELKTVQDHLKKLKKEEIAGERKEFSFASSMFAIGPKEKDLLGDGSVRKLQTKPGNGENWYNPDWLRLNGPTKCIVHLKCGLEGAQAAPVSVSYALGDVDMHEGINVAVKSMTPGEVANFTFAPEKLVADSALTKVLPDAKGAPSTWTVSFVKFVTWEDLDCNGERLQKIQEEGYGNFPEPLAELHVHWRVVGCDGGLVHSSRYTFSMAAEGGLKQVEDEDKPPMVCTLGENAWEPLSILCRSLRQGGIGELRLRTLPALPKDEASKNDSTSAQLSMMMNKQKTGEVLQHCCVHVELDSVVQPIAGPEDPRWEGTVALVKERFVAEQLMEKGQDAAAIARFQRVVDWGEQLSSDASVVEEIAAARSSIGWILARRAAPLLDAGNVTSKALAAAKAELKEAEAHCLWLEAHRPEMVGAHLLRAKILVAEDDDFEGAHERLLQAQRLSPDDKRVQEELKEVKVQLRQVQEEQSRAKVVELRDSLKRARTGSNKEAMLSLLRELKQTKVSWDSVMATRIGVELKSCSEEGGDEAKTLCGEILARFKDESKEQRPMWEA